MVDCKFVDLSVLKKRNRREGKAQDKRKDGGDVNIVNIYTHTTGNFITRQEQMQKIISMLLANAEK